MPNEINQPIRILIVDDQWLMREGIASLLEIEDGIVVVGTAANGEEAVRQAKIVEPDIILMDIRMPNMTGIEATAQIRRTRHNCQIIMLTTFDDEEYVVQSLLAGACGYLMKDIPAKELAQAIRVANAGILFPSVSILLEGPYLST